MMLHRILLRLVPALLAMLLFAAAPVVAEPCAQADAAVAENDGSSQNIALAPNPADHATRRPHRSASLKEFFEIDDDAEQYFKPLPVFAADTVGTALFTRLKASYQTAPRIYRVCAGFPTGPPHV